MHVSCCAFVHLLTFRERFCESGEGVRLPRNRADLWGSPGNFRGSPGNFRGSPGNFRGSLGNFRGTPGLLLSFTARELPGKSPKNFQGSLGHFRGSPGTFQKLGVAWLPLSDSPNLSPANMGVAVVETVFHSGTQSTQKVLARSCGVEVGLEGSASSKPTRICTTLFVCSYMAGHYPDILMTGHIGTNTPKFVPPRWGRPPLDPTQTGLCKFGWVWSSLKGLFSGSAKWERLKGRNGSLSKIFADFCRFGPWSARYVACGRKKLQKTAENRRKLQKIAGSSFDPFLPFSPCR